jgi:dethiobiotin synthetase
MTSSHHNNIIITTSAHDLKDVLWSKTTTQNEHGETTKRSKQKALAMTIASRLLARSFTCSSRTGLAAFSTRQIRVTENARTHFIFGANTDVGKTVITTGLVRASLQHQDVNYIKPLQCGGSDENFVKRHVETSHTHVHSNNNCNRLATCTMFDWETPASPHFSSRIEKMPKSDSEVLDAIYTRLSETTSQSSSTTWIETAGGVLSPSSASPNNSAPRHASASAALDQNATTEEQTWGWATQADLYQPLLGLAPVVLVGDGRLGGISATLTALESLILRGYHVAAIVMLETDYQNQSAIREYVSRYVRVRCLQVFDVLYYVFSIPRYILTFLCLFMFVPRLYITL